jgi:DNA-3-methyladenine glycosylase I
MRYNQSMSPTTPVRCPWAATEAMIQYHDHEWGVPLHDDQGLFELLILEGAQAGLNWATILKKRESYRAAFDGFDVHKMAQYGQREIAKLLLNPDIIRNKLKIESAVQNAKAFLKVREEFGSFDAYLWDFVDGAPIRNSWRSAGQVPSSSEESQAMSKSLIGHGFRFVGETICYALMQAAGLVNDHLVDCFRYAEL